MVCPIPTPGEQKIASALDFMGAASLVPSTPMIDVPDAVGADEITPSAMAKAGVAQAFADDVNWMHVGGALVVGWFLSRWMK